MKVRMLTEHDFLEELNLEAGRIERDIVRVELFSEQGQPGFRTFVLIATALIAGHIVTLTRHLGSTMTPEDKTDPVRVGAIKAEEDFIEDLKKIGTLSVRGGVYEEK